MSCTAMASCASRATSQTDQLAGLAKRLPRRSISVTSTKVTTAPSITWSSVR